MIYSYIKQKMNSEYNENIFIRVVFLTTLIAWGNGNNYTVSKN